MSDNYLHLIPTNPHFIPSKLQIDKALNYLALVWPLIIPEVVITNNIDFIDQGSNFTFVQCPHCGTKLDDNWWGNAMSQAFALQYHDLSVRTPCGHDTNLNDLIYHWPAGFARFRITFFNPGKDLDSEVVQTLSDILGSKLRKIWAHY